MEFCTGELVDLIDPATGEVIESVQLSTVADVDAAVATSKAGAIRWKYTDWETRSRVFRTTAKALRANVDRMASSLTQEHGKTLKESRIEVERCADTFDFYSDDRFANRKQRRSLDGKEAWAVQEPLGVVAAVVPWNFPLTLLANKLVPALAAGNGVVIKPAQTTPLTTRMLLTLLTEAGLEDGLVTLVFGEAAVGEALVSHPDIAMVSFTGSTQTGRAIMTASAGSVKRLALELGGSDPLIVDADANIEDSAKAASVGRFFNCGQACVAAKRVFVHEQVYDEFLAALIIRIDRLTVGDGRTPDVLLGPMHTEDARSEVLNQLQDAVNRGARVLRGGDIPEGQSNGYFLNPTLVVDIPDNAILLSEEVFGPVLPVVKVSSFDEALERANDTEFGLGASIWSNNTEHIHRAIRGLEAGYVWVNESPKDYDELPFGGVKQSGFGKERGDESIDEFRVVKSIVAPAGSGVF